MCLAETGNRHTLKTQGGDLPKWANAKIGHYVGIDIALKSVQDGVGRYNESGKRTLCDFPSVW
jgi:hypothetical protein